MIDLNQPMETMGMSYTRCWRPFCDWNAEQQ